MNYFSLVILYCIKRIKGERSISSIYHLLKGKRSAQTIQDAKLYQTYQLFGVFPFVDRKAIEDITLELHHRRAIEPCVDNNTYIVTAHGDHILNSFFLPESLNGWKYDGEASLFWGRLSLLVQVLSNLVYRNSRYIPISRDAKLLGWVKGFLASIPLTRDELSKKLYMELTEALSLIDEKRARVFVAKLTSYHRIGSTNDQVSDTFNIEYNEVFVLFTSTIHHLLQLTETNQHNFPIIAKLNNSNSKKLILTQSTERTYQYLQNGKSIDEISVVRQLRRNTIEDHIVEIALADEMFDVTPYVDEETYTNILNGIQAMQTNQLKIIKQALSSPVSYFQIRLVLAKVGGIHAT